jgi:putative hydrolase of the HAD superfamily
MFSSVKAVIFDAVGTLLHPDPAPNVVYADFGRRFGSRLTAEEIVPRFRAAFARQEALDAKQCNWHTSEKREEERWRQIVSEVFDDVDDDAELFDHLWAHFARPEAWRLDSDVERVFAQLTDRGLRLGIASNFDRRLERICQGIPSLGGCRNLFISAALGYRKPAREFMQAIEQAMQLAPDELLLVGDDLGNDFYGARHARWMAVLLDREKRHDVEPSIPSLRELPSLLATS